MLAEGDEQRLPMLRQDGDHTLLYPICHHIQRYSGCVAVFVVCAPILWTLILIGHMCGRVCVVHLDAMKTSLYSLFTFKRAVRNNDRDMSSEVKAAIQAKSEYRLSPPTRALRPGMLFRALKLPICGRNSERLFLFWSVRFTIL